MDAKHHQRLTPECKSTISFTDRHTNSIWTSPLSASQTKQRSRLGQAKKMAPSSMMMVWNFGQAMPARAIRTRPKPMEELIHTIFPQNLAKSPAANHSTGSSGGDMSSSFNQR